MRVFTTPWDTYGGKYGKGGIRPRTLRSEFLAVSKRKMETYAQMAGMSVVYDEHDAISDIVYPWVEPEEENDDLLPDRTCDRYCLDYWEQCGGPYCASDVSSETLDRREANKAAAMEKAVEEWRNGGYRGPHPEFWQLKP